MLHDSGTMNRTVPSGPAVISRNSWSAALLGLAAVFLGLLFALPAYAAPFGEAGVFSGSATPLTEEEIATDEEIQLGGASGMAVNYTGAGGVPPGTVYAATFENRTAHPRSNMYVAMYVPTPTGGLKFALRWQVKAESGSSYERCGPLISSPCESQPIGTARHVGVGVDPTTGAVYALNEDVIAGHDMVIEYSPKGEEEVTRFGERAPGSSRVAETPEKLHSSEYPDGIAVNGAGWVYVFDEFRGLGPYHRLAVFKPTAPGHYVYAGEVAGGSGPGDPTTPVVDAAGNIYVGGAQEANRVEMFAPEEPGEYPNESTPTCTFTYAKGGITALTVNPETGEPFFFSNKPKTGKGIHRLSACEGAQFHELETISVTPEREDLWGLAFDPARQIDIGHEAGTLYGAAPGPKEGEKSPVQSALGYIFARLGARRPPAVESASASAVTSTTARLNTSIDPDGYPTHYAFEYLTEAEYEANHPDARQSLTVAATGGILGISFEGRRLGGPALVDLTEGSRQATGLRTATGTATLSAAVGAGNVVGAVGSGNLAQGLTQIAGVATTSGSFGVGDGISGAGIPSGSRILAVEAEGSLKRLSISKPLKESGLGVAVEAGSTQLTGVTTTEGAFAVGQTITVPTVPSGTTITALGSGTMTISEPATRPGSGVPLAAGSLTLKGVSAGIGSFQVGAKIEGPGIPPNTTIKQVNGSELVVSQPATKAGTGVAISDPGPYPLAVGQTVEGAGIPAGTEITAIQAKGLTLSAAATATSSGAELHAGLPFDATAGQLRRALEGLSSVGPRNVEVSGGPGVAAGSSPYEVTFTGELSNRDVGQLEVDGSRLAGGGATVVTLNSGGGGFIGAQQVDGTLNGSVAHVLSATVAALLPDTTYRYQVTAQSNCNPAEPAEVCRDFGPSLAIHTYSAQPWSLPDGRAWELVSPAQKSGGQVLPATPLINSCRFGEACKPGQLMEHFPMQSAPGGNGTAYEGTSFGGGAPVENEYLASRGSETGWQTQNPTPPTLLHVNVGAGFNFLSKDLGAAVIKQVGRALVPTAPSGYSNLYVQLTGQPSDLEPVVLSKPENRPATDAGAFEIDFGGAAADGSRVFFAANDALETPATSYAPKAKDGGATRDNLYEWHKGTLALVNVSPNNATTEPGAAFATLAAGAISSDGSHAFFESETGQLFVRIDGRETRRIENPGHFLAASVNGEKVVLSDGCLYSLQTEGCVDLTDGKGGFEGVVGQSEDLSHVYFIDTEVLTGEEESSQGEIAAEGDPNLYAWTQGAGLQFVARLQAADSNHGSGTSSGGGSGGGLTDWVSNPSQRTAEASPNGRYLAFMSLARLTGYDNTGPCEENSGQSTFKQTPCQEAFVYDSQSGELACASCNPAGSRPLGWAVLRRIERGALLSQPRYLTNSGRLYFDTEDSLSLFDTNGGAEDVYEWEPTAVGGCAETEGCVALLSSGREGTDSNFLAMNEGGAEGGEFREAGSDVFLTTRQKLLPADTDELFDLYDAREGGGFAAESEFSSAPECQGDACQQSAPPVSPSPPTSSALPASGNVVPSKTCAKGKVKKGSKCVASKGRNKHKKHGRRTKRSNGRAPANPNRRAGR